MSRPSLRELVAIAVKQSEARARKLYASDATSLLQRYSILVGLLERIAQALVHWRRVYILYFPSEIHQLYCVYRDLELERFRIVEMRDHLIDYKQAIHQVVTGRTGDQILSISYRRLGDGNSDDGQMQSLVPQLVNSVLAEKVTDALLRGAPALLLFLRVPEATLAISPKSYQALTGLLILLGERDCFPASVHQEVGHRLQVEFAKYLETLRRFASYETDFFISSLVDQDARIQESAVRGIGYATYMLQHRFRNLRQAAQFVGEHFQTADEVASDPTLYEESIRDMVIQLEEALRLENILRHLGERPEIVPQTVEEVKEIFESLFYRIVESRDITAELEVEVNESLLEQQIIPPHRLIDEVFLIHLDNSLREIAKDETADKRLKLDIYEQGDYVCFTLTNFGPPVPPDVAQDLERVVRVRQPQRTGLGVFLSAMILQQVRGSMDFKSPIHDGVGTAVTLRFRKYIS